MAIVLRLSQNRHRLEDFCCFVWETIGGLRSVALRGNGRCRKVCLMNNCFVDGSGSGNIKGGFEVGWKFS